MGERRSVTVSLPADRGQYQRAAWCLGWDAIRYEFGPWWYRCWLVMRHGGRHHAIITGEPCVVFPASIPATTATTNLAFPAATPKGGA